MAGIFKEYIREYCPVCGHMGYCAHAIDNEGYEFVVCKRVTDESINGYVKAYTTKKGNAVYYEAYQYKLRNAENKAAWLASHGYGNYKSPLKAERPTLQYENIHEPLSHEKLDSIYRDLIGLLKMEDHKYFIDEKWPKELMQRYPIRSFPEDDAYRFKHPEYHTDNLYRCKIGEILAKKYGDLTGVPGAYINAKGKWTFAGLGGILFPCYDIDGNIYRVRIRPYRQYFDGNNNAITKEAFLELKEKGEKVYGTGKYMNFSSFSIDESKRKQNIICNKKKNGCQAGNNLTFAISPGDDMSVWYLTEGEKKAYVDNYFLKSPVVGFPGVSSISLLFEEYNGKPIIQHMKERGAEILVVLFDADKENNATVLNNEKALCKMILDYGISVATGNWDIENGKGSDDFLIAGGMIQYSFVC